MAEKKEVVILTFHDVTSETLEGLRATLGATLEQTYPEFEFFFTSEKMDTIPIDEFKAAVRELVKEVRQSG